MKRPATSRIIAVLVVSALTLLSACDMNTGSAGGQTGDGKRLEEVTFLDDPRDFEGPTTARMGESGVNPVTDNPDPKLPTTVTDAQGTEVTVDDVSRILALDLYGTTSRTIYELGLGDNIVGRDTSSAFPEIKDKPLVTPAGHDLNAEAILELAPTLIITDTSLGPWDVVMQMRDAGVVVVVVDSKRTMDNVGSLTRQIAAAVGLAAEGEELAQRIQEGIDKVTAQIAQIAPAEKDRRLRVIFLYMRGQSGIYYLFGAGSGTDSLITALGAVDVASEVGIKGMRPMTDEALVDARPDLVLVMSKGLESVGGIEGILTNVPSLAHTPAGQRKRIVDMDDTAILSFGPHTAAVLESLAVAIYAPQEQQ